MLPTPKGQRAREVVRVTLPESTWLGAPVSDLERPAAWMAAHAASEGARVAVVWQDLCGDAPGVYMRLIDVVFDRRE